MISVSTDGSIFFWECPMEIRLSKQNKDMPKEMPKNTTK
jgi:hypothetical protein